MRQPHAWGRGYERAPNGRRPSTKKRVADLVGKDSHLIAGSFSETSSTALLGAHALFKTSPLERLFRDGAITPLQFPPRDLCLSSLGVLVFDLDPGAILPPLKRA
jgi:hypothetical protein